MFLKILFLWLKLVGLLFGINLILCLIIFILYFFLFKTIERNCIKYLILSFVLNICFISVNFFIYGYFFSEALSIYQSTELSRTQLLILYIPLFSGLGLVKHISDSFSKSMTKEENLPQQVNLNSIVYNGLKWVVGLINLFHILMIIKPSLIIYVLNYYNNVFPN